MIESGLKGCFLVVLAGCASSQSSVGVGVYSSAIKAVSRNDDGSTGLLAPLAYSLGAETTLGSRFPVIVAIDYTPLAKKGPEAPIKSRYLLTRVLLPIGNSGVSLGPALIMHTQKGSGEVLQLNNGSSTAAFATPNSSVTSKILALSLGYDYRFRRFVIGNEILWQGFLSPSRWNFAWLLTLHYQFGAGANSASEESSGSGEAE